MDGKLQEVKVKKHKGSLLLRLSLLCFVAYVVFTLVTQQMTISEKRAELDTLDQQVNVQQIRNEEIQYAIDEELSGDKVYAEEYARSELDYAKQGERVFVNIGGN